LVLWLVVVDHHLLGVIPAYVGSLLLALDLALLATGVGVGYSDALSGRVSACSTIASRTTVPTIATVATIAAFTPALTTVGVTVIVMVRCG
jgi:hypothetical protein